MKKKIAKFTWLHNGNYGSLLQAVALQKFLTAHGYDVTDVDYAASLMTKLLNWWKNKNSPMLFVQKFNEATRKRRCPHLELFSQREKKMDEFRRKHLKLTPLCQTPKEVKEAATNFDIFICGSDQIWSPALMNPVYFLDSVPNNKVKIAYAPSFGVTETTERKKKQISKYLKAFDYLSVRELEGQKLIHTLIGQEVPIQVDPTMLITKEQWEALAGTPLETKPYIFCYLLTPNSHYIQAVQRFARKKRLPVILIPTAKGPFDTGFEERVAAGPTEWLNYIENASYVCTDSFHGCIFSAIFEKDFVLFKRFSDKSKTSENSRVYTLSQLLGIEGRLLGQDQLKDFDQLPPLDFERIRSVIEHKAKSSAEWLLKILETECRKKE